MNIMKTILLVMMNNSMKKKYLNLKIKKIKNKEKRKKRRKNEYYEINFISKDENFNGKKIFKKRSSEIESEQKNQSDQNIQ